jgi:hypothetical protein
MHQLVDILPFRRTIAPALLEVLLWAGICGVLYGTLVLLQLGH